VGCAGQFGALDGGIEVVDLATGLSLGFAVGEAALGGDLNRIQRHGDAFLAVVNDASFNTFVVRAEAGAAQTLVPGTGFVYADLLVAGDELYLLDRTLGAAGLRVFDPETGVELTAAPLDTGLPPVLFVAPASGRPAAAAAPVPAGLRLGAPWPNPFNPATTLALEGAAAARVRVTVSDLRGRRLRAAVVVLDATGRATWRFDGRDDRGRDLPAGTYVMTARGGGATAVRTATLVK
jgi:hypothetical protein